MEHGSHKSIISIFSTANKIDVFPKKLHIIVVLILSTLIFLLYLTSIIFNIVAAINKLGVGHPILLVSTLIEYSITFLSITISIYATYITNYVNSSCIKQAEEINKKHKAMCSKLNINTYIKDSTKQLRYIRIVEVVLISIFLLYFISSIICYFVYNTITIDLLSLTLNAISTILTIIMAIISTLSCYVTGKYNSDLLRILNDYAHSLFVEYNKIIIDESYTVEHK